MAMPPLRLMLCARQFSSRPGNLRRLFHGEDDRIEHIMPWKKVTKFLHEVRSEMDRVTWPTKDETIRLSTIVIILTLGVGAYIGVLDTIFTKLTSTFFIR